MKPIPRKLLIHSAVIKSVTSADRWGKETTSPDVTLKYIRIEPSSKLVKDKQNNDLQLSALMFFDVKNSLPAGTAFAQDQIIVFNNREYRVQLIDELYDADKLHHYELGLV
jgi:hypothetical protein